mgnify:CR=1 FL=1|jgi:hypothetical protein
MEQKIYPEIQNQSQQNAQGFAVCIEGDKSGFVSKSAIDKFKLAVRTNENFNLDALATQYIKPEFQINMESKTDREIKFILKEKPKEPKIKTNQNSHSTDLKERLREKLSEKYNSRTNSTTKETKYTIGQDESSEIIKDVIKQIQEKRPAYRVIDITNVLNPDTYVEYQKANYFTNIVMVAERIESNDKVFISRTNSEKSNIMVMYQGSYRTFNYELANLVMDSVVDIIKTK